MATALLFIASGCAGPSGSNAHGDDDSDTETDDSEGAPEARGDAGPGHVREREQRGAVTGGLRALSDRLEGAAHDTRSSALDERAAIRERAMDPGAPLPDPVRENLASIESDPPPEALTLDSHYWVSNEDHHHMFRETIDSHGGIYLGVGTDQNYLMAAWAESPILLLMDFDEQIRNLHHVYGVVLSRVDSPDAFVAQWSPRGEDEVRDWLRDEYDDEARQAQLLRTFSIARATVFHRLRQIAEDYRERGIPTFVTDQEQYDFIRGLWDAGRVFPIRGDLTGDATMVDIAQTLEDLGLRLGLVYTSNAEQYFSFSPAYRRNISVQPFAQDGLILRTRPMERLGYPDEDDYHYNIQDAWNFAAWLEQSDVPNAGALLVHHREPSDRRGLSFVRKDPVVADTPPEIAGEGEAAR